MEDSSTRNLQHRHQASVVPSPSITLHASRSASRLRSSLTLSSVRLLWFAGVGDSTNNWLGPWTYTFTEMKCYGFMPECNDKARNIKSYCGPCTRAKRALGQTVANQGSPQNATTSVARKKRKHERSPYEQSLCDRYALQCMSQCMQCTSRCICSNMQHADRDAFDLKFLVLSTNSLVVKMTPTPILSDHNKIICTKQ